MFWNELYVTANSVIIVSIALLDMLQWSLFSSHPPELSVRCTTPEAPLRYGYIIIYAQHTGNALILCFQLPFSTLQSHEVWYSWSNTHLQQCACTFKYGHYGDHTGTTVSCNVGKDGRWDSRRQCPVHILFCAVLTYNLMCMAYWLVFVHSNVPVFHVPGFGNLVQVFFGDFPVKWVVPQFEL